MKRYNTVKNDLKIIIDEEYGSIENLCARLNISKNDIYSILKDKNVSVFIYEYLYYDSYMHGMYLNEERSEFLRSNSKELVLFHGSKRGIDKVINRGSKANCDFGEGFYLGESYNSALEFVCDKEAPSVYSFSLDLNGLNVLKIENTEEWLLAVCYYRGNLHKYKNNPFIKEIIEKIEAADVVIAPIADNKMYRIMSLFIEEEVTDIQAKESLIASDLGYQYVLKSEKAIDNLKFLEHYYLCKLEKMMAINRLRDRGEFVEEQLKLAKRKYQGDGLYIDQLLGNENA